MLAEEAYKICKETNQRFEMLEQKWKKYEEYLFYLFFVPFFITGNILFIWWFLTSTGII